MLLPRRLGKLFFMYQWDMGLGDLGYYYRVQKAVLVTCHLRVWVEMALQRGWEAGGDLSHVFLLKFQIPNQYSVRYNT